MMAASNDPCQKILYENLLNNEKEKYYQLYYQYQLKNYMTTEELSHYDGSKGRPAYVAVNGIVYDVSLEATWGGGTHFSLYSGQDLSS